MSLKEYIRKRNPTKTAEPFGSSLKKEKTKSLVFVVQKHDASHLHYDFRLEADGVLKSWAIPKGPSLNPAIKRLAIMVEDHPFDYKNFEGTIPEGSYGAGTVMIWDEGNYFPIDAEDQIGNEEDIERGLKNGTVSFVLNGKKLRGKFTLIKLKKAEKNEWLLIKSNDEFASKEDVKKQDTSVISRRNLKQIAEHSPFIARDQKSKTSSRRKTSLQISSKKKSEALPLKNLRKKAEPKRTSKDKSEALPLTNLDKIFWPKEKFTKGDLIDYYRQVAPFILPYLKDRPESLLRFPNGIEEKGFFQKNVGSAVPSWITTVPVKHEGKEVNYLMIQDIKSLLFTINLGCIDLNPLNSRYQTLNYPDYMVLDLDPEKIPFEKVIETAQMLHELLESAAIPSYCKTSGATGLHIYVPLGAQYNYEQVKNLAQLLALIGQEKLPDFTSVERSPKSRQKRVYIDFLQNNFGQTLAAPYSVRPRLGAPVSTPLEWKEVKKGLDPLSFNIKTIMRRLKKKGDLFAPVLGKGIDLAAALKKLQKM